VRDQLPRPAQTPGVDDTTIGAAHVGATNVKDTSTAHRFSRAAAQQSHAMSVAYPQRHLSICFEFDGKKQFV